VTLECPPELGAHYWIGTVPQMWGHGQTWTLLSLSRCLLCGSCLHLLDQDFSFQTYPTYYRKTTANLKASYVFCAQNDPSITHSSQHNVTFWKRAAEGRSFGLMLQLDLRVAN
jgi:hypothetical protein